MDALARGTAILLAMAAPVWAQTPCAKLYTASLHTFSIVRSGVRIDDPLTGIHHPASHTDDATLAGTSDRRDLTGGWYNAGDYGKWPMLTAITVSYMLNLYDLQERAAHRSPRPTHAADPALLENAQWGLAWMLKMQDDDGGVRQKVDGVTWASLAAAWGKSPELDPNARIAAPASTGTTADFAGAMYQAAEVFAPRDPEQSRRYRAAADRAWEWLAQHPNVPAHDPFYIDHDSAGELLWARAEHDLAHRVNSAALIQEIAARAQPEVSWLDPSLLGVYRLASSPNSSPRLRRAARTVILKQADVFSRDAAARSFRVALGEHDYWWGSAERVLHRAALFLMADSLQPSVALRRAASDQLAWMLGNNAVQHSFVTAFGTNPVLHPWHWTYRDYGIVMPGWAVGGPNGLPEGVDPALKALQTQGTPPERCYLDLCSREGSWGSNEGEISEEAALVFVTGALQIAER